MAVHPKRKRPEGTKKKGKFSAAFTKTKRLATAARRKEKRSRRVNVRRRSSADRANERREKRAFKTGNVKVKTTTSVVSPSRRVTVKPGTTSTKTVKKFTPFEVRAGNSKSFGKERPKGVAAPSPKSSDLQRKLEMARRKGQDLVKHKGLTFRTGRTTSKQVTTKTPAVTRKLPAITTTKTQAVADFKKKSPRIKTKGAEKVLGAIARRGRVVKLKTK